MAQIEKFCPEKLYIRIPMGWYVTFVPLLEGAVVEKIMGATRFDTGWQNGGTYLIPKQGDTELTVVKGKDILEWIENGKVEQQRRDDKAQLERAAKETGADVPEQPF